jgi:hypothetical protein
MAWETRGNGQYYYRKKRIGNKVYSEYVGAGLLAEASAIIDQRERDNRAAARAAELEEQKADLAIDRELNRLGNIIRTINAAALVAGGYHTHKGQWRRQRKKNGSIC